MIQNYDAPTCKLKIHENMQIPFPYYSDLGQNQDQAVVSKKYI